MYLNCVNESAELMESWETEIEQYVPRVQIFGG